MAQLYTRDGTADQAIVASIFAGEDYSPDLIDYTTVKYVVDVGAHIGAYSLFIKDMAPDAQVVAIEPDTDNAVIFLMNTRDAANITLIAARVAYEWRDVVMVRNLHNTGSVSFVPSDFPGLDKLPDTHVTTPGGVYAIVTLEQALGRRRMADVLKVDCEGGEFDILINAPLATLARFRWIVGEYHTLSGDIDTITRRLRGMFALRRQHQSDETTGVFCYERHQHAG